MTASAPRHPGATRPEPAVLGIVAVLVLVGLGLAVALVVAPIPWWVPAVYGAASLIAFLVYGADKSAARRGAQRVPESQLHLLGLLGGWPGALLARHLFRHKTVKPAFRLVFWATVALNLVAFVLLTALVLPSFGAAPLLP